MYKSYEDLIYALLTAIGLTINQEGYLADIDSRLVLQYGGKNIKASLNPLMPAIATDICEALDPVFDYKQMQFLLSYFLTKCEMNGEFNPLTMVEQVEDIPTYNDFKNRRSHRSRQIVVCAEQQFTSEYYYQRGLKYTDIILQMSYMPITNLWQFDSLPEEGIVMVSI